MRVALVLAAALLLPTGGMAQEVIPQEAPRAPVPPPVLVVNQDAMFEQSAFGRAAKTRLEAASATLVSENRAIEAALEAEERSLTERRANLPPAEFRALAEAFNTKVEGIRKAQDSKSRSITRVRDEDRQQFFAAAAPVLEQILREQGAVVVLERRQVVRSLERIDITALAVRRMDEEIGTGTLSAEPPQP